MTRFLIPTAIGGVILLALATLWLAKLNWSEKLLTPLLSLLVVGIATAFVTIWLPLKESSEELQFSTSVALVKGQRTPPMIVPQGMLTRVMERLSDLERIANATRLQNGRTEVAVAPPANDQDTSKYCGELIQYAFVSDLEKLQRPHHGFQSLRQADGQVYVSATAYTPYPLAETKKITGSNLYDRLRLNRFADSDRQGWRADHAALLLPPGTQLTLEYLPSSQSSGPEKHIVVLEKPQFFKFAIIIEASFGGIGPSSAPNGVKLPLEQTQNWETHTFRIIIRSKFEKLTSGNSHTEEYKAWLKATTTALEQRWSDVHNSESP